MLYEAGWTAYRIARRGMFTGIGRNPLVRGPHAPSVREEWRAVRALKQCRVPLRIGQDAIGTVWGTEFGSIWAPRGASVAYVDQIVREIRANVYGLRGDEEYILDCGANIGIFCLDALRRRARRIIAVEPSPDTVMCLRNNTSSDARVELIERLLWSESKVMSFDDRNEKNPGSHSVSESGAIQIQSTTIDSIVRSHAISRLDFIKMDIEGSEYEALRGAMFTLKTLRPRIAVAVEHTDDQFQNACRITDLLVSVGYQYKCLQSAPYMSPSQGRILSPHTIVFDPI